MAAQQKKERELLRRCEPAVRGGQQSVIAAANELELHSDHAIQSLEGMAMQSALDEIKKRRKVAEVANERGITTTWGVMYLKQLAMEQVAIPAIKAGASLESTAETLGLDKRLLKAKMEKMENERQKSTVG